MIDGTFLLAYRHHRAFISIGAKLGRREIKMGKKSIAKRMENDELSLNHNEGVDIYANTRNVPGRASVTEGEKHVEENVLPNWNFPTSLLCFGPAAKKIKRKLKLTNRQFDKK